MSDILNETFEFQGRLHKKYTVETGEDGEENVKVSPVWNSYKTRKLAVSKLLEMGLDPSFAKYGFDTYVGADANGKLPKLKKYLSEFTTRYYQVHLYFWSRSNSTQKSTMAKAILLGLLEQGINAQFVLMSDLLKTLPEESFSEEKAARIALWRNADFLVVDDSFDPGKATVYKSGFQFAFLDTFLRQRLEVNRLATCFTSNVSIDDIEKSWTISIARLVKRSIPDPMEFQDSLTDFSVKDLWD